MKKTKEEISRDLVNQINKSRKRRLIKTYDELTEKQKKKKIETLMIEIEKKAGVPLSEENREFLRRHIESR